MIDEEKRRGRPAKGVTQVTFTLEQDVVEYLNSLPSGQKSEFANTALRAEIRRQQTCSMCDQPAALPCEIGNCAPITWYCSYHYMIKHHPEDGDE
jgi:hypothetical protein